MALDARRVDAADLIVVGGSVGGLAAAILAADRGCRTIVLERSKDVGGSASTEPERIAAAGTRFQKAAGIADGPDLLAADIVAASGLHQEAAVIAALARGSATLVEWLADRCGLGIELSAGPPVAGHSVARLHAPSSHGGSGLVAALARATARHSRIAVRTGAVVEHLARDETGAVLGVAVKPERRAPPAYAGRVLIACGGFVASDELVAEHCPDAAALPHPGWTGAVGEGLRLGREVGAQTRRLGSCTITPFLALPGQLVVSAPLVDLGAALVNQAGTRFVDETSGTLPLAAAVRAQPGRVAYLVFDDRIAAAARGRDTFFANVVLPRFGRRAERLEDLARQFELHEEGLHQTIEAFDRFSTAGSDPLGRRHFGSPLAPPYHAIRITAARRRTLGGLAVDERGRVLGPGNEPIAGLYATGGAAAGFARDGTSAQLAGTDALAALGLGRLAALDAVAATQGASAEES